MRTRRRGVPGQTLVEFALVAVVAMILAIGTAQAAILSYEKTTIDYAASRVGDKLPAGWDHMDRNALVKQLLLEEAPLDPARLEVTAADVKVLDNHSLDAGDGVAGELGTEMATRTGKYLRVRAKVAYDTSGLGTLLGTGRIEREVDRTFSIERRYEVS